MPFLQIGKIGLKNNGGQDPLNFVYIPSHLYHILFELFKNAMRATIDQAGETAAVLPPVEGELPQLEFRLKNYKSWSQEWF
jgi:hypothetical protein